MGAAGTHRLLQMRLVLLRLPSHAHHPHLLTHLGFGLLIAQQGRPQRCPRDLAGGQSGFPLVGILCCFQSPAPAVPCSKDQRLVQPAPPVPPSRGSGLALPMVSPLERGHSGSSGSPSTLGEHLLPKATPGPGCLEDGQTVMPWVPKCQGDASRFPKLVPGCPLL